MLDRVAANPAALRLLESTLSAGEVAHAYLFYGPSGVGKRTTARWLAASLVAGGDNNVESRVHRGLHPDVMEVLPAGAFTTIGQVREVVKLASTRPFEGLRRVFILQADTLNIQAANSLLKTLEQPEGDAVFILLAVSKDSVLETVLSRTQLVRFDPVPVAEVAVLLQAQGDISQPDLWAALGRGSIGRSLRYAREPELREMREAVLEAVLLGFSMDFEFRYRSAERIGELADAVGAAAEKTVLEDLRGQGLPDSRVTEQARRVRKAARDAAGVEALELISFILRDLAAVAAGAPELVINVDKVAELKQLVREYPDGDWIGAARIATEARENLTYNVSLDSILEVLLLQIRKQRLISSRGS